MSPALVVWIAGINYQNSLMLALAFFMLAMFLVVMVLTYQNLAGLKLTIVPETLIEVGRLASNTLVAEAQRSRQQFTAPMVRKRRRRSRYLPEARLPLRCPLWQIGEGHITLTPLKLETRYPGRAYPEHGL